VGLILKTCGWGCGAAKAAPFQSSESFNSSLIWSDPSTCHIDGVVFVVVFAFVVWSRTGQPAAGAGLGDDMISLIIRGFETA